MAKQTGLVVVGRRGNIIYYQWKAGYYMRSKSSLTGERVRRDPAFANSRKRAIEFGVASKLATTIFRLLPKNERKRGVMGSLTGRAHRCLLNGRSLTEARDLLLEWAEQLLPKAVLQKYRRKISGEKSPGITRQHQWIIENKPPSYSIVTTSGTLQLAPGSQEPKPPDRKLEGT